MEEIILKELIKNRSLDTCNDFVIWADKSDLQPLAKKIAEAISVTRCSLQLLCVDTHYFKHLTLNRKYELIEDNFLEYTIVDDNNEKCRYPKKLFKLSEQ